jgi:signal transduction histidine kinase
MERCQHELQEAISGIRAFDSTFRILTPSGETRYLKGVAGSVLDHSGVTVEMFGVNFDVTDAVLAAQKQEKLLDELTRINGELNTFTYSASHDLKSPLRGIDQLASWIAEDLGDDINDQTKDHLRLMRSRIDRMERLLGDLLAYSRVGRSVDDAVSVITHELVDDIYDLCVSNKNFTLHIAENMPVIETYKVPLELVFRNLISNAVKHHDKAAGNIWVSAEKKGDFVEFLVRDDGPGVSADHQDRVFGMFQTLRPRDEIEGSGIGLALVKKSIETVGGKVVLESDGHNGCTFRFTWPCLVSAP